MKRVGRPGLAGILAALCLVPGPIWGAPAAAGPSAPSRPEVPAAEGLPLNPVDAAEALWKAYAERVDLDARTDLLHLEFKPGILSGAVAVSGTSADRGLLAGFYAELSASGLGIESSVEEVPNADDLKRLTWGIVKTPRGGVFRLNPMRSPTAGRRSSGFRSEAGWSSFSIVSTDSCS